MTLAQQVFRNTTVLAGARIIERASGLILALVVTRHLGAAGLGAYATAIAYFGLIALAGESGSTNLLIRELSKSRERTSSYVVHTSAMAVAFSFVVMAVALAVIPHLGYGNDLEKSLELIVLAVIPGTLNTIQEAVFVAHGRVEFETITTFVSSVVLVAASAALLWTGHGVVPLVGVFVVLEYVVTVVYYLLINRYIARLRFELRRSVAVEILRELKSFAGSSFVGGLFARPEIIILSLFASEAQVGYYSGAAKIVDVFQFVPQVYMTNVFPLLSRSFHERDGRAQEIQNIATKHLLSLALPITVGLIATSDRLIDAFYGDDFGDAVAVLRILAITVVLFNIHAVLWRVLAARGEQARVLRIQLVSTGVRLGGGTILIILFKAIGAAVIVPIALLLHVVLLGRAVRSDGTAIPLVRLCARFVAATLLMGAAAYALDRVVSLWAVVVAGIVLYVAFVALLRAFSREDLALFRSVLPSIDLRSRKSA